MRLPDLKLPDATFNVGGVWIADVIGGIGVLVDHANRRFALGYRDKPAPETVSHCLYDHVMPRLLALDGHLVLHGGLVLSPRGALGFIAPSGEGKSTLTASLHCSGLPLMSDDAMILKQSSDGYFAERFYPSLRLLPDSLEQLFPQAESTTPVAEYTDKRRVPFDGGPDRAPLAALFRLGRTESEIAIRRLSPADACMVIVSNSFTLDYSSIGESRGTFDRAADAARHVRYTN